MEIRMKNLLMSKHDRSKDSKILLGIVNQQGRQIYSVGVNDKSNISIENRIFEIGSISKVFTATLLQTVIMDDIVQLNDPVSNFQPKYVQAFSIDVKKITLKDLITHHANLPRYPSNIKVKDKKNPFASYEKDDLDKFLTNFKLKKYKRRFKYSNVGVGVLGNILADLLDTEYEEAISNRICKPLGMHDTFVHLNDVDPQRVIKSYRKNKEIPPFSAPALQGAGL